jgi:hypothetical protein
MEYAAPTVPGVSGEVVVIVNDPVAVITSVNCVVAVWGVGEAESVAVTLKLVDPAAVGVPLMTPALDRVKPTGRPLPWLSVHVTAPVPPVAVNWRLYGVLTTPEGIGEVVVIENPPLLPTLMTTFALLESPPAPEFVIVTLIVVAPAAVGVPVIAPVLDTTKGFGVPLMKFTEYE